MPPVLGDGWAPRLEDAMRRAITADDAELGELAYRLIRHGGKRIRPQLLFLSASLGEASEPMLMHAAAVVELLHAGSLLHDDVMDCAGSRRGHPSANTLWGNSFAIAAGSHVLACAMKELAFLPLRSRETVTEEAFTVCSGQLRETEHVFDTELEIDEHIEIIGMKTATLFRLPCQLGAELAGCDTRYVNAMSQFGQYLGIAFQLADDVLDLIGDPSSLGKPTGTDLRSGVFSYAVLHALRHTRGTRLTELLRHENLTWSEVEEATDLICRAGSVAAARGTAQDYAAKATAALRDLPDFAGRTVLAALPDSVVSRTR